MTSEDVELAQQDFRQKRLLTFLFSKDEVPIPTPDERIEFPQGDANFLSIATFSWILPILRVGYKRTIQKEDVYKLKENMTVEHLKKGNFNRKAFTERSLMWETMKVIKYQCFLAMLLCLLAFGSMTCTPIVLKKLIAYVEAKSLGSDENIGTGIGYAIGTAVMASLGSVLLNHYYYQASCIGIKMRSLLTDLILEKSFRLNAKARHDHDNAAITSLMTTDLSRIQRGYTMLFMLICVPLPLAVTIAVLIVNLGTTVLISIGLCLAFLAGISFSSRKLYVLRKVVSEYTDSRVRIIKEVVNNLKMIKYYAWEQPYFSYISEARSKEVRVMLKLQTLRNLINALAMSLTGFVSMITFVVIYAVEGRLRDAGSVFASVQALDFLGLFIFTIPSALSSSIDLLMGYKRVAAFLSSPELVSYEDYHEINDPTSDIAITVENGCFEWEQFTPKTENISEETPLELSEFDASRKVSKLNNIKLEIKKGAFIIITGLVGSGKTSLLNAIGGTMKCNSGIVTINGNLLDAGAPWIQNSTIRTNILFGLPFDKAKYDAVIFACCLHTDIANFEGGDLTEVGERGITLSGGQKARICLARAVYANADIILLDDVLSAVDAKVGKHIVKHCIFGLLKEKTRLLATHQLSLVTEADEVIFLNGNGTIDSGLAETLKANNDGFRHLAALAQHEKQEAETKQDEKREVNESFDFADIEPADSLPTEDQVVRRRKLADNEDEDEELNEVALQYDASKGKIITEEERAVNGIKKDIYVAYVKAGTKKITIPGFLVSFVSMLLLAIFAEIFTNTWLSFWVDYTFDKSDKFYLAFYVTITLCWVLFSCLGFTLLSYVSTTASKMLNIEAAKKILHTTMSFMDTTPVGRISNRFTKDTDALDNEINESLRLFFFAGGKLAGFIILDIIYLPWVAIAVPILAVVCVSIASFYQASCREVRRIEAVLRSHVYNNHSEILTGMHIIKRFRSLQRFLGLNNKYMNEVNESTFLETAIQRWYNVSLELLVAAINLLVALLCVGKVFKLSPATVGLLLSYTTQIGSELTAFLKMSTEVENSMNSVERLCQYSLHLPQEDFNKGTSNPKDMVPTGDIEFQNVSMSYRPGLPLVLKDISFKVNGGEKIGICGRTGAGKSSIITALYRLVELERGKILVNEQDISALDVKTLRTNLSIIPQDPVLFDGTIRRNLDPFGDHDDDKLWDVLKRTGIMTESEISHAKSMSTADPENLHKFHLDQEVVDEGANFSLGERQLISFARALVRESKILILDEATSSVDYETDSMIQETIKREFKDCAILCIAHRLNTIINYDKIMTLEKGEISEFDTPFNLFNSDGIFRSMCEKSNIDKSHFQFIN